MQKQRGFFYHVAVASTALTLSFVAIAGASSVMVRKNIAGPVTNAIAQSVSFLKDLSDVSDSLAPSNGQVLTYSGGQWTSATPGSFSESDTLATVTGRGATTTATITATGFVGSGAGLTGLPAPTNGASLTSLPSLGLHSDVTLTTPTNGQILSFNGTDWVNSTPATLSESDTLADVTGRGATTTATITAGAFVGDGSALTNLPTFPSGMVAAFDGACPSGWISFSAATGRTIVGSGTYGANADADGANASTSYSLNATGGNINRTFSTIVHTVTGGPSAIVTGYVNPDNSFGGGSPTDIRMPYVVLNYCKKT